MQSHDIQYNVNKYNVISSDGIGYYSYLPSIFVKNEFQVSENKDRYILFDKDPVTKQNKYFVGTSVLMAPFFGIAHIYTSFHYWIHPQSSFIPNGYTFPYQLAVIFAGVFYLLLGFYYLKKITVSLGVKKSTSYFLIISFALGSQLLGLASYEASFSHVYAFFTISILLYYWHRFTQSPNLKYFLTVGALASLLTIIRPTDLILLLCFPIFLILNGNKLAFSWLKQQRAAYVYLIIIGLFFLYLQLFFWKLQSGSYFIWSYSGEGFNFANPEIWNVLFSYKKGLFVYTPILIIVVVSIAFSKIKPSIKIWFLSFFLVNTYVISSWWCWWYGGSYGMRAWMDFMPIVYIVTALSLSKISFYFRMSFYALALMAIPITIIQSYQYSYGIMHWESMTKDKFWQIFLKTHSDFDFVTHDPSEDYKKHLVVDSLTIDLDNTFENVYSVEKNQQFYTLYEAPCATVFPDSLGTYLKVSFEGKLEHMRASASLTVNKNRLNSTEVIQKSERIIAYIRKSDNWTSSEIVFDLGKKRADETDFSLFLYNNQRNFFWIRNVSITFYYYQL